MEYSQAHLSMGFPRREYWSGLTFPPPGDLPNSGMEPASPTRQESHRWATSKAPVKWWHKYKLATWQTGIPKGKKSQESTWNSWLRLGGQHSFPWENAMLIWLRSGNHRVMLIRERRAFLEEESESKIDSVVPNSLRLRDLYSPWNSPGQNTGVGSLSLLQGSFQPKDHT